MTVNVLKICQRCRHYGKVSDKELCVDFLLCSRYHNYIGDNKHNCKKLKKGLIKQIKEYRRK